MSRRSPPAITLVTPVRNRRDLLPATLESVLAQTREDFELIVWDDGSSDDSAAVARAVAGGDPRVRVVEARHQGLSGVLEAALAEARGEFLGWVDSDDLLLPRALETTAKVLEEQPGVGLVYSHYETIDLAGKVLRHGLRCEIPFSLERQLVDYMTFQFRLIRRSVYQEVGGIDKEFVRAQDHELCQRLAEAAGVVQVPEVLYQHRDHPQTISRMYTCEQIEYCRRATERALVRRGLADRLELSVTILPIFRLIPREPAPEPS